MFSNYIMPLGFLQFDNEPEGISKQLDEDLKIINGDLPPPPEVINPSVSPFVTEPKRKLIDKVNIFKPPPVNHRFQKNTINDSEGINENIEEVSDYKSSDELIPPKTKPIKSKKPLSEKQKAHLEKMRLKRVEKKKTQIEKKMEKSDIVTKIDKTNNIPVIEISEEELLDMDKKEFEKWIKNMDKFEKMMNAMEKEKQREMEKLLKLEQKEKQKELDLENKIRQKIKREQKQEQDVKYNKPTYQNISTQPILQQPTNEYGEYSNMFGY